MQPAERQCGPACAGRSRGGKFCRNGTICRDAATIASQRLLFCHGFSAGTTLADHWLREFTPLAA
jgi:hypothetical protein